MKYNALDKIRSKRRNGVENLTRDRANPGDRLERSISDLQQYRKAEELEDVHSV